MGPRTGGTPRGSQQNSMLQVNKLFSKSSEETFEAVALGRVIVFTRVEAFSAIHTRADLE